MSENSEFEANIESLDVGLFSHIDSQTTVADKRVLLAIQRAMRRSLPHYVYLEIGSHLGGTIQPHLLDPRCLKIYSIDSRPFRQPDVRGIDQIYPDNSTERMLERLRSLAADQVPKMVCFDSQSQEVDTRSIDCRPQICFIDGEHTDQAVGQDFEFCLSVVDPDGVIIFHDADLVYRGIQSITARLKEAQARHKAIKLDGSVYSISLGNCAIGNDPTIRQFRRNTGFYFLKSRLRLSYRRYRNRKKSQH
jgi:hypothetical protein